jgi:hypothetical protein
VFGLPRSQRRVVRSEDPCSRTNLGHVARGALHERDADLRSPAVLRLLRLNTYLTPSLHINS